MTDRSITIIAAILIILVLGALTYHRHYRIPEWRPVPLTTETPDKDTDAGARVIARMTDCRRIGNRTRIEGFVENTGKVTLASVTVQSHWKNANGLILDTGIVYVVHQEDPLAPGERRNFNDVTQLSNISKCNVVPLDWSV